MDQRTTIIGSSPTPDTGASAHATDGDPSLRRAEVAKVVADVVGRRSRGENVPDTVVLAARPDLHPELQSELAALRDIHRIFLAAQKAGPMRAAACDSDSLVARVPDDAAAEQPRFPAESIQGYAIVREASCGGQGAVFRAVQESTGKQVAIKVIWGGPLTGSRHRARFEREAQIMAKLDHAHIVPILDRGRTADGSLFLVMPFIEGCALDEYMDRLRKAERPDVDQVVRLFVLISRAVAEAHRQGVIHRDLKPTNVRIDTRGEPHILDFGLARTAESAADFDELRTVTITGQIVGSLPWASPEQVSPGTDPLDVRSDVYSLGVMLYQSLCGTFPYPVVGSVKEVLENIQTAQPQLPSTSSPSYGSQIRAGLDAIVLRALAKEPRQRYASAGELADDLERYLAGGRLDVGTEMPRPRPWRMYAAVAFVVVVTIGIGGIIARQQLRPSAPGPVTLRQITNSIGMRLAMVPPGEFMMGSPRTESGRTNDESLHRVAVERSYLIGVMEVTQEQYRAVMGSLPPGQLAEADDLPVHNLTRDESIAFCQELTKRDGRQYRLPTETEWEYACRASASSTPYAWPMDLDGLGWYAENSGGQIHAVARRSPNIWGLYDMHGGVREWCDDPYLAGYVVTPADRAPWDTSRLYIARGGSFQSPAHECRCASRSAYPSDWRLPDGGFRVVSEDAP